MQLLVLIIKHIELVDPLIKTLADEGIPGGTIINSTGMASVLENYEDFPMFGMLRKVINNNEEEREIAKTMLFVLNEEEMEKAKVIIKKTVGDLSKPNTGIMFAVPVSFVEGLGE